MPLVRPSPFEYVFPILLLVVCYIIMKTSTQTKQFLGSQIEGSVEIYNYPVFFPGYDSEVTIPSGYKNRLYCTTAVIDSCTAEPNSTAKCCVALANKSKPGESISTPILVVYCVLLPLAIIFLSAIATHVLMKTDKRAGGWSAVGAEVNAGFYGLVVVFGSLMIMVMFFKKTVGAPRPNCLALLALVKYDPVTYEKYGDDAFMNVPSGHSALAVACFL